MKCTPSQTIFDAEWFHVLLREAQGVNKDTEPEDFSELHKVAAKAAETFAKRLAGGKGDI